MSAVECIRALDKAILVSWICFRFEPDMADDTAGPENNVHFKIGQKNPKNIQLAAFFEVV